MASIDKAIRMTHLIACSKNGHFNTICSTTYMKEIARIKGHLQLIIQIELFSFPRFWTELWGLFGMQLRLSIAY